MNHYDFVAWLVAWLGTGMFTAVAILVLSVITLLVVVIVQSTIQRLCRHSVVRVIRFHRGVVRPDMQGKQLYVDRHNVHNFVECCRCQCVLKTKQRERLYEESKP
jgi:hypothetical protein